MSIHKMNINECLRFLADYFDYIGEDIEVIEDEFDRNSVLDLASDYLASVLDDKEEWLSDPSDLNAVSLYNRATVLFSPRNN